MRYDGLWMLGWCMGILLLLAPALVAGELNPSGWKFIGPNAGAMKKAVDNNLDTCWESDGSQAPGLAMTVDLGKSAYVYRVYLTPGREVSKFPRSLNVYVGESLDALQLVAQEQSLSKPDKTASGWESPSLRNETVLRFPPVKGRYVKLEIGANGAGLPWAIAEMDIHAATKDVVPAKRMTVVLDRQFMQTADGKPVAFNPMKLAAEELQYYLMELTDTPVDIVALEAVQGRTDLHFTLVTPPAEQVPAPEPDPKNLEDVSIVRVGNDIRLSGLTRRAILFGVYEFLASQGVRWLYPDPHGDSVPVGKTLNLSVLPIAYHPPFGVRGLIGPGVVDMSPDQFSLFQVRHAFNMQGGHGMPLGTVPRMNCGFGWAHTMGGLLDDKVQAAHPDWWPGPYRNGWYHVPSTANPEVAEFIRQKIEDTIQQRIKDKQPPLQGFSVHPNDSPCFSEDPLSTKMFGKPERVDRDGAEESAGTWNYSDYHFFLINKLALRLKQDHPELFLKTLAYANHERPPKLIDRLPDNVLVDICPWWHPLPVDAPQNAGIRDNLKAWKSHCASLGIWSYVLIYSDTTFGNPAGEKNQVIPNARAIADQNNFYREQGFRQVSTQLYGPQNHWPWALYTFAHTSWHPDAKADTVIKDFFQGYYGEAWEPMLQWYQTLEQAALANNIDTSAPDPRLFAGDRLPRLRTLLDQATKKAQKWYVKERVALARADTEWTAAKAQWKTAATRPYPCYRFKTPPVLDGTLNDPVWRSAPEMAGFNITATRVNNERPGRMVMQNPTRFRMGWDDKFLYIGMVCQEPGIEKTRELDAKDTKFVYRNVVEMFFAPEAPPYYRQTIISSAGFAWGPMKIRQVNANQLIEDPNFACKTAYTADGWTLEARFPLAMLASVLPTEGTCWPANLVRVANQGRDTGEQYSSWSEIPRFNFHEYYLGAWSLITFHGSTLSEADAVKTSAALNYGYLQARQRYDKDTIQAAAFERQVAGITDLSTPSSKDGIARMGFEGGNAGRNRVFQVVWSKAPATFDAVRIVWSNRKVTRSWYSIEYWDGERYRLIDERRDNNFDVSLHEFAPITASRLRLTIWPDLPGWTDVPSVKAIEVYKR